MSKTAFASLLAQMPQSLEPFGYKQAQSGVESPDQTQMEQDFARLAHMFIQDRAAPLLKYMLGFEVVNRDEDGSRAVGIFGFKIGKDYYYVPAFFLNNQIKGVDMLFCKRTNSFVPLQEDWVNFIVNKQTIELGGAAEKGLNPGDFENPDFTDITRPPQTGYGKMAGATDDEVEAVKKLMAKYPENDPYWKQHDDHARHKAMVTRAAKKAEADDAPWSLRRAWDEVCTKFAELIDNDPAFQQALTGAICSMTGTELPFEKTAAAEQSLLRDWISEKGGPRAMSAFLGAMTSNPKFAEAALTFYPNVASLYVNEFNPELLHKEAGKVTVTTQVSEWMDGKHRKRIVRDGFTIKDERPESMKSEAFDVDYERMFSNPDKSATYQVLMTGGRTTKAWVFMPSTAAKNGNVVVVETDKRMHRLAEPGAVYVRDTQVADTSDAYSKAVDIDNMELDTMYVIIDEHGNCTAPVQVQSVIEEEGKRTKLRVSWRNYDVTRRPTYGHDFETLHGRSNCIGCCGSSCDGDFIELAKHKGGITKSGSTLIVPSNWKALKLYDKSGSESSSYEMERATREAFQLGSLTDVMESMTKNAFHKLAVASDGSEFYLKLDGNVSTKPMTYKQACIALVQRLGLGVEDSETILKEASDSRKCVRTVKLAQMQSPMVGVAMPPPQEQGAAMDPYTGVPMYDMNYQQSQQGQLTGMPPPPDGNQQGINIGGEAEMDVGAQDIAAQAGQAGQKQIFDHAAIGGLAKMYDTGAVIDSYVPELMKALDRLGRILFLFYWKNEDFAERYGDTDIAELEDTIRGVFKNFGDLVLQLRRKTIDSEDAGNASM